MTRKNSSKTHSKESKKELKHGFHSKLHIDLKKVEECAENGDEYLLQAVYENINIVN